MKVKILELLSRLERVQNQQKLIKEADNCTIREIDKALKAKSQQVNGLLSRLQRVRAWIEDGAGDDMGPMVREQLQEILNDSPVEGQKEE